MRQIHTLEPVFDENSRILILGTFPSVKSREAAFYYAHPQNRFWKVMAKLLDVSLPDTIEDKKSMLLGHGIAIWDVIQSCDITGSSDASILNVIPNDLSKILKASKVKRIFANGHKAYELYHRYCIQTIGMEITALPSTSPANARVTLDELSDIWKQKIG